MMSFLPAPRPKYQYSTVRFFEREHGIEFTKYELDQMQHFAEARKQEHVEITGYVAWCRPPYFLLLPTTTTPNGRIICKVEDGLNYPDLNQYSTIRGNWKVDILKKKLEKVLVVSDIVKTKQDFGKIKPDISTKDFVDILFEKWRNIRGTTKALISQSFVSSPTTMTERTGGFTLTFASYSKKNALDMFLRDLNRFIPADFTKNKSLSFPVPELGIKANLPKFGWDNNVANIENIPKKVDAKLDRIPQNTDECSITLLQNTMGPFNFDARGMVKSDYPIVLEEHVERTRVSYDVDLSISKFILATRLSAPTVSLDVFNHGILHNRNKITKLANDYDAFSKRTGNEQFLDLGHKGKPLSIHNLAISIGRSNSLDTLSTDEIENASQIYIKNLENVMEIQELWGYDEIPASATMSITERRIWTYLRDNPDQSALEISDNMGIPFVDIEKNIRSLLMNSAIYESGFERYSTVSQY